MSQQPAKSRARTCSLWHAQMDRKKKKRKRKRRILPVMSRASRFDPGSDHRGGSKSGRRTPPPRLAPAQREKRAGEKAPAGRDDARSGRAGSEGAFSPSQGRELRASCVMGGARMRRRTHRLIIMFKKFFLVFFLLLLLVFLAGDVPKTRFIYQIKQFTKLFTPEKRKMYRK